MPGQDDRLASDSLREALRAHLHAAREIGASEPGQFTIDPERWVSVLSTLAKDDPLLWVKNLCQWHTRTGQRAPLRLRKRERGRYRFELALPREQAPGCAPAAIAAYASRPGGEGPEGALARILALLPPGSALGVEGSDDECQVVRHASGLVCQPAEEVASCAGEPVLWVEMGEAALQVQRLLGASLVGPRSSLLPFAATMPVAVEVEDEGPLQPDWPLPPQSDSDTTVLWDWESVEPDEDGFAWLVSAWCQPFDTTAEGWDVISHPVRRLRGNSEMPLLGCYPASLARTLLETPSVAERPFHPLTANRVFGISWNINSPPGGVCYPVIGGIICPAIALPHLPSGLSLLARADHLRTDATGIHLVQNSDYGFWLDEQVGWMKRQVRAYLPCIGSITTLWTQRVSTHGQLHKGKSWVRTALERSAARLCSTAPLKSILVKRRKELLDWVEENEPSH